MSKKSLFLTAVASFVLCLFAFAGGGALFCNGHHGLGITAAVVGSISAGVTIVMAALSASADAIS